MLLAPGGLAAVAWTLSNVHDHAVANALPKLYPHSPTKESMLSMSITASGRARVKTRGPHFCFLKVINDDGEDGEDVFVGRAIIEQCGLALSRGDFVNFSAETNARGLRAVSVTFAD
jgi:cold shock CspA family protein